MSVRRVVVLDYGSGNLRSAERALARTGVEVTVTPDLELAASADGLVVPGVGAYEACMTSLNAIRGGSVIHERLRLQQPVLGICVGMQILFERGLEHGVESTGLGVLPGDVTRLRAPIVPHMGWNTVRPPEGTSLFTGVEGERFYFVHSYAARHVPDVLLTTTEHGEVFTSAVESGALSATQFHPEKSGDAGAHLLENWVRTL